MYIVNHISPLVSLNSHQQSAIQHPHGVHIVIAGPGTGKTHTLIQRLALLVTKHKIKPQHILAVTFTNHAADEMRRRLQLHLSADQTQAVNVCTVHALCLQILVKQLKHPPEILTDQLQKEIVEHIRHELKSSVTLSEILHHLYRQEIETHDPELDRIQEAYLQYRQQNNLYSFDDLITETINLFQYQHETRSYYQNLYQYIHVDEFQDLNTVQQELIIVLAQKHHNLFAIGDPRQAIYGFRGANVHGFTQLAATFPNNQTYSLITNYRSSQPILDTASSLFPDQPTLQSTLEKETIITQTTAPDEKQEAQHIIEHIQQLLGGITRQNYDTNLVETFVEGNYTFGDIAVLLRQRSQFSAFKPYLLKSGIPFSLIHAQSWHTENAVQQILAILKRSHPRSSALSLTAYLHELVRQLSIDPRQESVVVLFKEAAGLESGDLAKDIQLFIQYIQLLSFDEQPNIPVDKVLFLTIHAAKGLEFPVVFIPGLVEGILPSFSSRNEEELSEERRLLYVALTRAKQQLHLSLTNTRTVYGKKQAYQPSRFLVSLSQQYLKQQSIQPKPRPPVIQKKLF